jgi:hypothetical protein
MRLVDCSCHLPNVLGRLAFRLNGIDVNVSPVPDGQVSLGAVQVLHLCFQQRIHRPIGIHRDL